MTLAPIVQDRRQLFEYYETLCSRSYSNLRSDQRLDLEQNLVKSYIIEVHPEKNTGKHQFLKSVLANLGAEAIAANDETLFSIRRGDYVLHCDAFDERFWILHASTPAGWTDGFVDGLTRGSTFVDVAWFHSEAMESLAALGQFLGFTSEYDPRPFEAAIARDVRPGLTLNFRRPTGDARLDLEKLRQPGMFLDEFGLSSIRLRFGDGGTDFALADITHSGKFTERGPSFSAHSSLIGSAISAYDSRVRAIEHQLSLSWSRGAQSYWHLEGSSLAIEFRPFERFDVLLDTMFNGKKPFRLWGLPLDCGDGQFSVHAVDLHVGASLRMDISNGCIRVYLPDGSCGNTVTRLLTQIQRHIDARARIAGPTGTRALESTSPIS